MNKKIDLIEKLDFSDVDLTAPDIVIKEVIKQIEEETNGIICGNVEPYNGHIVSYTQKALSGLTDVLIPEKTFDVQETLGKRGEEVQKYEVYINTPSYNKYKYRICYIQYGIANYPVKIVLEQSIADDIFSRSDSNYIVNCYNRSELEDLIVQVVCSKRMVGIMQELIRINQIQKEKKYENDSNVLEDEINGTK